MARSTSKAASRRFSPPKMAINAITARTISAPAPRTVPRTAATTNAGLKVATPRATARLRTLGAFYS